MNFVSNVTAISSDPQGYSCTLIWDQVNRITGIKIPGSASPSITVPGVTNAFSLNQAFAYDQLDRITSFNAGVSGATTLATGMALLPNETFTYDGIGNRKSRTTQAPGVTSTQATSYTHTTGKHWLASATGQVPDTWTYDATGNATYEANAALWGGYGSNGTTTSPIYTTTSVGKTNRALVYTYDGKNRPVKVAIAAANASQTTTAASANTVTYRFNALGQRVLKVGAGTFAYPTTIPFSGTLSNPPTQAQLQTLNAATQAFYANSRFIYDEKGRLLGEYSKDGKLIEETVWFDDLPVAILKPKGASISNPLSGTTTTGNQGRTTRELTATPRHPQRRRVESTLKSFIRTLIIWARRGRSRHPHPSQQRRARASRARRRRTRRCGGGIVIRSDQTRQQRHHQMRIRIRSIKSWARRRCHICSSSTADSPAKSMIRRPASIRMDSENTILVSEGMCRVIRSDLIWMDQLSRTLGVSPQPPLMKTARKKHQNLQKKRLHRQSPSHPSRLVTRNFRVKT